jgi:outer membrane protein assembly factor BamB
VKKHSIGLILLGAGLIGGCRHAAPPPQPTYGPIPAGSFVKAADANLQLQKDRVENLYLCDEKLIVYTQNSEAFSLDRSSLTMQSLSDVGSRGERLLPPVVFRHTIIFPTDTSLQIYNHRGQKLRAIDLHRALRSPLIGSGSILYTGVDYQTGGRVIAINPDNPEVPIKWEFLTNSGITAAPAYANGILYIGTEDGQVIAAQDQSGASEPLGIFHFNTAGEIVADLKADDYGVYIASTDTKLYCLDPNTGHIKWQYFAQHPLMKSPTVTATRVYQAVPDVGLVALDKENGPADRLPLWTAKNVAQILSEDNRCVYVRLTDNSIAAIDKQTGKQLFASHGHHFVAFATNTRDATIFASTADGQIYAIRPVFTAGTTGELVMEKIRMKLEG